MLYLHEEFSQWGHNSLASLSTAAPTTELSQHLSRLAGFKMTTSKTPFEPASDPPVFGYPSFVDCSAPMFWLGRLGKTRDQTRSSTGKVRLYECVGQSNLYCIGHRRSTHRNGQQAWCGAQPAAAATAQKTKSG